MKIIDARSGHPIRIGETYRYSDVESVTLIAFKAGPRLIGGGKGQALLRTVHDGKIREAWVDCLIRKDHPAYPGQRVAFLPP